MSAASAFFSNCATIRSRSTISAIPSRSSPLALAKPLSACCHRIAWVKNTSNPPVWFLFKIQDEDVPWTQMIFFKFVRNLYILSPHKIMMMTNKLENGFSVFYSTMLILSWCWSRSLEKGSQCKYCQSICWGATLGRRDLSEGGAGQKVVQRSNFWPSYACVL